jgi:3-isopropylmalate dehydrogenase
MKKYSISVLRGDGIGPEVIKEGLKALNAAVSTTSGLFLEFTDCEAGAEVYRNTGEALPETALDVCSRSHAIFKAPVGLPNILKPDGMEAATDVILGLRSRFDLYVNLRPIILNPGVPTQLVGKKVGDINYAIVRENTEGLYVMHGGVMRDNIATNLRIITRKASERIVRFAFEYAMKRGASPMDGAKRVTCVDSSKILISDVFFRRIFGEIAKDYPDVERDYAYVDAFAQWQILRPEYYHVVVTPNLYGDIISDLAGATVGSIGLVAGGNIGDDIAMFEPIHGSAPTLAGKGLANPIAMIQAGEMMMRWLGDRYQDASAIRAAYKIEHAVKAVLRKGRVLTFDLGGKARTEDVGNVIAKEIESQE